MARIELLITMDLGYNQCKMIVKRKAGFFVLSEKIHRNLGGPYKTREEAVKRLRQVEYFKHLKK